MRAKQILKYSLFAIVLFIVLVQSVAADTSVIIQRQTWVDSGHWETQSVWVSSGYWTTRQVWVAGPIVNQLQWRASFETSAVYSAYVDGGYWEWQTEYIPGYWSYVPGYWAYQSGYWNYAAGYWSYHSGYWSYHGGSWSYHSGGWHCGWSYNDWDGWYYDCWYEDGWWEWNDGWWEWVDGWWEWTDGYWYWVDGYSYWAGDYWYWVDGSWTQNLVWIDTGHWDNITRSASSATSWVNVDSCTPRNYGDIGAGNAGAFPSSIAANGTTYELSGSPVTTQSDECQVTSYDSSHWESQSEWIDTGYWNTQTVWIPDGYWQTWTETIYTNYSNVQNGSTYASAVQPMLSAWLTPNSESISSITYRVNNGVWNSVTGNSTALTESEPGTYAVQFYATDSAGNRSALDGFQFTIQNSAIPSFCEPLTRESAWLLWFGPRVGQSAQAVNGRICEITPLAGQSIRVVFTAPSGNVQTYWVTTGANGNFHLDANAAGNSDLGTTELGDWSAQAFLDAYNLSSHSVQWTVQWFIIHTTK
ncbi:MAG: hypothetical protein HY327_12705 [Chloroflexi bacterium]|nr:hypothetical protein [Chloroflexota bacterium]